MSTATSRPLVAEIDGDDAEWLRGQRLPDGVELREVDEVLFWGRTYEQSESGLLLPQTQDPLCRIRREVAHRDAPTGLDLFSGAGGFSLGMHQAGIDVIAAAEWDVLAAQTYLLNLGLPECRIGFGDPDTRERWLRPRRKKDSRDRERPEQWIGSGYRASRNMPGGCRGFYVGDISRTTGREILALAGVDRVNAIFGGPPCQGLSRSNAKACIEDPRNACLWDFLRIVEELEPDVFMIENVPGLLTAARGALIEALAARAVNAGYEVRAQILDAVQYGVPQYRRRALVVGTSPDREFAFPMPTHWSRGWRPNGERWCIRESGATREAHEKLVAATFDAETRTWSAPTSLDEPESEGADRGGNRAARRRAERERRKGERKGEALDLFAGAAR